MKKLLVDELHDQGMNSSTLGLPFPQLESKSAQLIAMANSQEDHIADKSIISQDPGEFVGGAEDVAMMLQRHKANLSNPRMLRCYIKHCFPDYPR